MNIVDQNIPPFATQILELLENEGFEAWCVGGCVRDSLLNMTASDIDITTNALASEVKKAMSAHGYHTIDTGIAHGTVTVLKDGRGVEVTTYRSEGTYSDNRHPDSVEFVTSLKQDLSRRDFTMNAIAYHPSRGLFDPFEGQADIKNGVIRCVGEPSQRFLEDALRILRACRFSSQLGFSLEKETFEAMKIHASLLSNLSVQRLRSELERFICGDYIHDALMKCSDIIAAIIPELRNMKNFDQKTKYHIYDVLEHTAYCMQYVASRPLLRWAALFHDFGKPHTFFIDNQGVGHFYGHEKISREIAEKHMKKLALSSCFRADVLALIRFHDETLDPDPKSIKRMLRKLDEKPELFYSLLELKRGDARAQAPFCHHRVEDADQIEKLLDEVISSQAVFSRETLAIDGNDILSLGVKPGPIIHDLLNFAVESVIEGIVENEHTALLSFIKDKID